MPRPALPARALLSPISASRAPASPTSASSTAPASSPRIQLLRAREQRVAHGTGADEGAALGGQQDLELPELCHSPRERERELECELDSAGYEGCAARARDAADEDVIARVQLDLGAAVTAGDGDGHGHGDGAAVVVVPVYEQTGKYSTISSTIEGDGWWPRFRRIWIAHVSIRVPSAQRRDHLALERSFLGYLRTSLALSMVGVMIAQLLRLDASAGMGRPDADPLPNSAIGGVALAAAFIAGSIVTVLTGAIRFWRQQVAMQAGKCWAGGPELLFIWGSFFALSIAMFVIMLIQPDPEA